MALAHKVLVFTRRSFKSAVKKILYVCRDMKSYPTNIHELIKALYTVVASDEEWPTVIDAIGEFFRSHGAGLFLQNVNGSFAKVMIPGIKADKAKLYDEHYGAINPWFTTQGMMKPGVILTDKSFHEEFGFKKDFFYETEFYQDWFKGQKFHHAVGGQLLSIDGKFLNFTLMRDSSEGQYSTKEIEDYTILSSHILQALTITQSMCFLRETIGSNAHAFELLGKGFAVVSVNGVLKHCNQLFVPLLGEHADFNAKENRIVFRSKSLENSFFDAIRRSLKFSLPVTTNILDGMHSLNLQFIPPQGIEGMFNEGARLITVIVSTNKRHMHGAEQFRLLKYPFTDREMEILKVIVSGGSTKQAAEALNISYETTRWHLKNIMKKVGSRTQNDLIYKINQACDKLPEIKMSELVDK